MSRTEAFYHGTDRAIQHLSGSAHAYVLPHAKLREMGEIGGPQYPELYRNQPWRAEHVFSTTHEPEAWSFAAHGRGRPRVYEVEPVGHADERAVPSWDVEGEHISRSARVLGAQFTPPPLVAKHWKSANWRMEPHGGVQGTLHGEEGRAGEDWNRFHDMGAELRAKQANEADERADRAKASVAKQDKLNNRKRQRTLF